MSVNPLEVAIARSSPLGLLSVDLATGNGAALHCPEHLLELDRRLVDLALGRNPKRGLAVSIGPRHGKSNLCSVAFAAWFVASFPTKHFVLASAEQTLAQGFSRQAREIVERRSDLLAVELDENLRGSLHWRARRAGERRYSGSVRAVGTGSPLTGHGASMIVCDDLTKNAQEAHSRIRQESLLAWFRSVATTRLEPKGKIVLVGTKWCEGDILDTIAQEEPDQWDFLSFPALNEDTGEPLWPERFDKAALTRKELEVGSYVWEAQYLCRNPSEFKGSAFPVERIEIA